MAEENNKLEDNPGRDERPDQEKCPAALGCEGCALGCCVAVLCCFLSSAVLAALFGPPVEAGFTWEPAALLIGLLAGVIFSVLYYRKKPSDQGESPDQEKLPDPDERPAALGPKGCALGCLVAVLFFSLSLVFLFSRFEYLSTGWGGETVLFSICLLIGLLAGLISMALYYRSKSN